MSDMGIMVIFHNEFVLMNRAFSCFSDNIRNEYVLD